MNVVEKVGAFVIRKRGRNAELLLFIQPDSPDAPIQIPGGSLEHAETPENGVRRELKEEAGVEGLTLVRKVGISEVPWQGRVFRRHCFVFDGEGLPERWVHEVFGSGVDRGMKFEFSWHQVRDGFSLSGDLGYFLDPQYLPELFAQNRTPTPK